MDDHDHVLAGSSLSLRSSARDTMSNFFSSCHSFCVPPLHFHSSPVDASSSSPSSHFSGGETNLIGKMARFIHVTATCLIAAGGSLVGAVTGGLIGLATDGRLLRGAGIGAISGVVFTIEALESLLVIWPSNESGIWSTLFLIEIVCRLMSGRLFGEKVGPAMQNAVQTQMRAVDSPLIEAIDIFDSGGSRGLTWESVDQLPKIQITSRNSVGDTSCVVCLQDFETGQTVRCLPKCQHKFHLPCINGWLIRHGSCPLCRQGF